jgi:23S rRNA pseudouridine1911/1915/1917 synthase
MDSPLNILYEDNHIISVNKSNNDLVQKDITGDLALDDKVREYIRIKYSKPGDVFLGVVHRIDRPVSGAVLFARTSKTLGRLNKMLRENLVNKKYWAVVRNKPPQNQDMLVNYLVKNPKQNKSYCYDRSVPGSKEARLEYRIAAKSDNYYLLEINLITGRHHQIRAQLSHINCPFKRNQL